MNNQIAFEFPTAQIANRFINTLRGSKLELASVKLYRGNTSVLISYTYQQLDFDRTASELDEIAASFDGNEVNP
ncbi:hypothetical protein [Neptunicella marina]|uniref:Uncharacterized protein n=1 Tax=Neptunicella marina TaxID=2125989 RepID=A0A8J6IV17_9ALTE|nr:hypothetical protein [Neptunicella marina]MBC3766302.1 hypothetical protein [Neptunicella marina]